MLWLFHCGYPQTSKIYPKTSENLSRVEYKHLSKSVCVKTQDIFVSLNITLQTRYTVRRSTLEIDPPDIDCNHKIVCSTTDYNF